jgi:hypothetical protein
MEDWYNSIANFSTIRLLALLFSFYQLRLVTMHLHRKQHGVNVAQILAQTRRFPSET